MTIVWYVLVFAAVAVAAYGIVKLSSLYRRLRERELPPQLEGQTYTVPDKTARHPRFGVGAVFGKRDAMGRLGAGWYMNWRYKPFSGVDLEFMPMIAGFTGHRNVSRRYLARLERYIEAHPGAYPDGTIWLVGCENGALWKTCLMLLMSMSRRQPEGRQDVAPGVSLGSTESNCQTGPAGAGRTLKRPILSPPAGALSVRRMATTGSRPWLRSSALRANGNTRTGRI